MRLLVWALALCFPLAAADARVVFSKSFPGSVPAYVQIVVEKNGAAEYREDLKDEQPLTFQLSAADVQTIFELTEKLEYFSKPVESGLKVAFMGAKTFRFEDGKAAPKETTFNYSEDLNAKTLLDWFERIAETERLYIDLERAIRFDKIGVNDAVLHVEVMRDQKRLVAEEQFLPFFDRIVKSESFLHMARARAASLAESIRAPK